MTDPDRLAEFRERRKRLPGLFDANLATDADWLVGEVERLRDLVARLEWPETLPGAGPWHVCPVCSNHRDQGHDSDCWLAIALEKHEAAPS